jgi:hypothetical protein
MHEAGGVRGVQGRGDGGEKGSDPVAGQRALLPDDRAQVPADDEPHRQVEHAVRLAGGVDGNDVQVVNGGDSARLPDEPLAELRVVGERGREDLQRDGPAEGLVPRAEDDCHPSGADLRLHPVPRDH